MSYKSRVVAFKRELVREVLDQCTEKDVSNFNKWFGSVDSIKEEKIEQLYDLCRRTLIKNGTIAPPPGG